MDTVKHYSKLAEDFGEQGYVILRDFIKSEEVEQAKAAVMEITEEHIEDLFQRGKIENKLESEPWETRLARIYENCSEATSAPLKEFKTELHKKGLFSLFGNPRLLDAVEQILGPEIRLFPNYMVRPKLPDHEATRVLWHQDAGYTFHLSQNGKVDQVNMVNIWASFVPATTENGCMQFIPKTHKLGLVEHVEKEHYLEMDQEVLRPLLDQAIDIEMNPGDVVLFSNLLFHQGLANQSQSIRWSADWRYQDATQATLRNESGHILRSQLAPDSVVKNADHWAQLSFS
jgi:ectoine hydroxylase-related dioxygenase (phytanoyl-CoA dioxygenase family)